MNQLIIPMLMAVPFALLIAGMAIIANVSKKKSRLPFSYGEMGRIPGFSQLQKHKEQSVDLISNGLMAVLFLQMPFAMYGLNSAFDIKVSSNQLFIHFFIFGGCTLYCLNKALKVFRLLRNTRLGVEAEWAVSESLTKITVSNVRIFHDIQCGKFNIDHVLTFPGGVFAIETKGRRKPNKADTQHTHKVSVLGDTLKFPHYDDFDTIQQANRQAKWLTNTLTSSTGMQVNVKPMVVIPGWYVELKTKPKTPVLSQKQLVSYCNKAKPVYSIEDLSRINHQLELLAVRGSDDF